MSDIYSGQPIRSQIPGQSNYDDIIVKIGDGTTASQLLAVDSAGKISSKLFDGAGVAITSQANGGQQALDVGINVGGAQIDPRSIRALTSADVVTVDQGTSPWVVSGTVTANQGGTWTVQQGGAPWSQNVTEIGGSAIALGQTTMAGSIPVVLSSNQSAIPVTQSGSWTVASTQSGTWTVGLSEDHNYGVVGASTLRTAAQIGNATGAANFNAGATGAQTLRVESNQGASATAANGWFVKPTDGTNSQSYTAAGEAKVDITVALPTGSNVIGAVTQSGGPWSSNVTEIGGSALALGQTTMSASIPVTIASNQSALPVSQSGVWSTGRTWTLASGTDSVSSVQSGTWTVGLSQDMNWGTVGANTLRTAAEIGNAAGAADFNFGSVGAQTLRVASQIGNATGAADFGVGAAGAQTLRVFSELGVAGANVSATNPVPVIFSPSTLGTPINDYKESSAIAAGSSDNHDYSISSGKVFNGKLFWASASGLMKMEVQISPDGTSFVTKWVGFNSTSTPNIAIELDQLVVLESGVGSKIRIIVTNLDKKVNSLYSTISGTEV